MIYLYLPPKYRVEHPYCTDLAKESRHLIGIPREKLSAYQCVPTLKIFEWEKHIQNKYMHLRMIINPHSGTTIPMKILGIIKQQLEWDV